MTKYLTITVAVACVILYCACSNDANESPKRDSLVHSDKSQQDLPESTLKEYDLNSMLMVDLNGDNALDYVQFNRKEGKVLIALGEDSTRRVMTFETEDGTLTDEFGWVDSWGIYSDKAITVTFEIDGLLEDSTFTLENPAIKLWQDGGGSGFFTFKGGKFVWVTTGC